MCLGQELANENKIKPYKKVYLTIFDHINIWQEKKQKGNNGDKHPMLT